MRPYYILVLLLALAAPGLLIGADCPEICQAYLQCVEKTYPGESTEKQKQTILLGCQNGCSKNLESVNQCYLDANGQNGMVESCEEFSTCILQQN